MVYIIILILCLILYDHYHKTLQPCCQFGEGLTKLLPERKYPEEISFSWYTADPAHGTFDLCNLICDPPYDFRDKGKNMLTTFFHLKTKEIDFNILTKHVRAYFNEPVLLSHMTH